MTEVRSSGSYISCWFSPDFTMIDSLIAGNNSFYSKSQDMPYVEQFHEEHRVDMIAVHLPVSVVTNDSIIVVRLTGPALKEHIISYTETKVGLGGPIMFCDSTQWDSVDPIPSFKLVFTR